MDHKSEDTLCGPCYAQHITTGADHWCPECAEGICNKCQLHHSSSKATRNHEIISIESYKKIPTFITDIADNCEDHGVKCTMYCPQDDVICCPVCIANNHSKCIDLKAVSEFLKHAKISALLPSLEQRLKEMHMFVSKVIDGLQLNESTIKEQTVTMINQIKEARSKINAHFDSLEKSAIEKLDNLAKETDLKLKEIKEKMDFEIKKVEELEDNLHAMKTYGSDIQVFYGSKSLEAEIEKEEKRLESVSENKEFYQRTIACEIKDQWSHMLSKFTTFGSVVIEIGAPFSYFHTGKNVQSLSMSSTHEMSSKSDTKQLTRQSTIYLTVENTRSDIKACIICQDGKMVFADYANLSIIILNPDKSFYKSINVASKPNDLTSMDDSFIAVSTNDGIKIIDIASENVIQNINTSIPCHGISYHEGSLYWCQRSKGIQKFQPTSGEISTLIPQSSITDFSYVAIHKDRIYQSDAENVTCYTMQGNEEWKFKVGSNKDDTRRVTVDNDANIYVTSFLDNSVVMISPDGKHSIKLLGGDDNFNYPTGIFFDMLQSNLLVTNDDGVGAVYHVS